MAEWLMWIKDRRPVPLSRTNVKRHIEGPLAAQGVQLMEEPSVVIPPERHLGEWCLRVSFPDRMSPISSAKTVLGPLSFGVLVCQQAPRRKPLRSVPNA